MKKTPRSRKAVVCPYCEKPAALVSGTTIYPNRQDLSTKKIWQCAACDAHVGCHDAGCGQGNGSKPLGTLANAELRAARKRAHAAFDPIWTSKRMRRVDAYDWLSIQLGRTVRRTHIALFGVTLCERVVAICHALTQPELSAAVTGTPPNKGKPWTPELDSDLEYEWFNGKNLTAIALEFGRTEGSISSRLATIHLVPDWIIARQLANSDARSRGAAVPLREPETA